MNFLSYSEGKMMGNKESLLMLHLMHYYAIPAQYLDQSGAKSAVFHMFKMIVPNHLMGSYNVLPFFRISLSLLHLVTGTHSPVM